MVFGTFGKMNIFVKKLKNLLKNKEKTEQALANISEQIVTKSIKEFGSSDNCTLIIVLIH